MIYLPSKLQLLEPGTPNSEDNHEICNVLAEHNPTASLVTINYRLAPRPSPHIFPIPIHDTTLAFDHILSTIDPDPGRPKPKICLYGTHIGGALATMLALTQPNEIHALAISQPLVDWVGLEEYTVKPGLSTTSSVSPRGRKSTCPTAEDEEAAAKSLIALRTSLFRTPSAFFDPFASPLLFLRAPGRDPAPSHNVDEHNEIDYADHPSDDLVPEDDFPEAPTRTPSPPSTAPVPGTQSQHRRRSMRRVLRRWRPATHPATLPYTGIFRGPRNPPGLAAILTGQSHTLASLMRRACFPGWEEDEIEDRVREFNCDNDDGTDQFPTSHHVTASAAKWLRDVLLRD